MRLVFSTVAQRELLAALYYYENQHLGLGAEFLDELDKALGFVRRYPEGSPITDRNVRQRHSRALRSPYTSQAAALGDHVIARVALK